MQAGFFDTIAAYSSSFLVAGFVIPVVHFPSCLARIAFQSLARHLGLRQVLHERGTSRHMIERHAGDIERAGKLARDWRQQ